LQQANDKAFSVVVNAAGTAATVKLEDMVGQPGVDHDYDDRTWDVTIAPFVIGGGPPPQGPIFDPPMVDSARVAVLARI
jgi:hypothetical protein